MFIGDDEIKLVVDKEIESVLSMLKLISATTIHRHCMSAKIQF